MFLQQLAVLTPTKIPSKSLGKSCSTRTTLPSRADDNVPGGGSINSVEHELDDPGGGAADDDPGGGSITSADADSALIVSNASKTSSSPMRVWDAACSHF